MLTATPKQTPLTDAAARSWPSYYAGYSEAFVRDVFAKLKISKGATVADPWNGSGTTTTVARAQGIKSYGYDINPAVVLVARARLLNRDDVSSSLRALGKAVIARARKLDLPSRPAEPLERWLVPSSAEGFRRLEVSIQEHLIRQRPTVLGTATSLARVSNLAAYFYVALFRALRGFLAPFQGSNPTWIRTPSEHARRLRPRFDAIAEAFLEQLTAHASASDAKAPARRVSTTIDVCDSVELSLEKDSVDFVLGSPPYCTRIDYAVATLPELCLLGIDVSRFDDLRARTIGSCVAPRVDLPLKDSWGPTCKRLLKVIRSHPSKGSKTYYFRQHAVYFDRLQRSLSETRRILRDGGRAVFVVQDSYYKGLHTDLQQVTVEMMERLGFEVTSRADFHIPRTIANLNTRSRQYRTDTSAIESALIFSAPRS
jgi:tRNA G10  N-methylase Trm11